MIVIIAFVLGLVAIAVGAGMIYLPAGIIAAGVGLVALSIILSRGRVPDTQQHPAANPLDNNTKNTGGTK